MTIRPRRRLPQWGRAMLVAVTVSGASLSAACHREIFLPESVSNLDHADALVRQGCYQCLLDARRTYETIPSTPTVAVRVFAVNILIGLRRTELALDPSDAFSRADRTAADLPRTADAAFVMAMARALPPDTAGTPRRVLAAHVVRTRAFLESWTVDGPGRLARAAVPDELRAYLMASLPCLTTAAGVSAGPDAQPDIDDAVSVLVQYRRATCPVVQPDALEAVVAAVPSFVEAAYLRVRTPTLQVNAADLRARLTAIDTARKMFPDSPSVAYSLGSLLQTVGDCPAALAAYDDVLASEPAHEDATLQRIICLGFEGRHENAVNAATRAIDASYDNGDDFYYWRAWNRHTLRQFAAARQDIDTALVSRRDSDAYTLAGMIAYDQRDFSAAERYLSNAVQSDSEQCLARWYLGLVAFARELWIATADDFAAAAACYRHSADEAEEQLAHVDPTEPGAIPASQVARLRATLQEARQQEHASSLNAANGYARSNAPDRAAAMLAGIPDDSPYAAGARELLRYLADTAQLTE